MHLMNRSMMKITGTVVTASYVCRQASFRLRLTEHGRRLVGDLLICTSLKNFWECGMWSQP